MDVWCRTFGVTNHMEQGTKSMHANCWMLQSKIIVKYVSCSYSARQTIIKIFLRNACVAPPTGRKKISHQAIRKLVDYFWILATAAQSGKSSLEQLVQRTFFFVTPFRRDRISRNCFTGPFPGNETVFILANLQMYRVQKHGAKNFVGDR